MGDWGQKTGVVLDRHPLWRDAMGQLLERLHVHVVGTAASGEAALALVDEHAPDLLVMSLELSGEQGDGLALLTTVRERYPSVKPVVVSAYEDAYHIDAAFAAGATVYCLKTAEPDDLASAIRQAFEHSVYFAGARSADGRGNRPERAERDGPGLTRREYEILRLVAEGHSNAQLARMLWVTEQTVKFHLSNIYRKLDVSNRTEASRWAQLNGLLPETPRAQTVTAAA